MARSFVSLPVSLTFLNIWQLKVVLLPPVSRAPPDPRRRPLAREARSVVLVVLLARPVALPVVVLPRLRLSLAHRPVAVVLLRLQPLLQIMPPWCS